MAEPLAPERTKVSEMCPTSRSKKNQADSGLFGVARQLPLMPIVETNVDNWGFVPVEMNFGVIDHV